MPKVFQSENHGRAAVTGAHYFRHDGGETKTETNRRDAGMSKMQMICAVAAVAAFGASMAWCGLTFDRRMEEARKAGAAEADAKAEAVGGWEAWTHRSVNAWCRANGRPDAYAGEGALDAGGKAAE